MSIRKLAYSVEKGRKRVTPPTSMDRYFFLKTDVAMLTEQERERERRKVSFFEKENGYMDWRKLHELKKQDTEK